MAANDYARMAYLLLLAVAIIGWFIAENRARPGKLLRMAAVWGFIFLGLIAAAGLWSDIQNQIMPRQSVVSERQIEVPRGRDGHFRLVLQVNGKPITFIVDTGASDVVLTQRDARRIGLDPRRLVYSGSARTANGAVRTAYVRVKEMRLGDIVDRNVGVSITKGQMDTSLLGMSYLRRFAKIEIAGNRLTLIR